MTLVKQLRTWDEMPNDDDKAFHWLDLKTAEAADEIESLRQQLARCIDTCATRENEIIEAEQQLAAALAACKLKDAALKELRRAIGDHYAPHDCYATGPVTGNDYRDLVECPACSASAHYDEALAIQPDDSTLEQFAAKVREQCIEACNETYFSEDYWDGEHSFVHKNHSRKDCIAAIRAIKELPQ